MKPKGNFSILTPDQSERLQIFSKLFDNIGAKDDAISLLGKSSWFFSIVDPPSLYVTVLNLSNSGKIDQVDEIMTKYYIVNSVEILERVKKHFPEMKDAISEASYCFNKKKYFAFISTILPLCEYAANQITSRIIGRDITNVLFNIPNNKEIKRRNKKKINTHKTIPAISYYLDGLFNRYDNIFKHSLALAAYNGVNANTKYLISGNQFNRHAILHGLDLTYGTEVNAAKAICFLNFVVLTLNFLYNRCLEECKSLE